VLPVLVAFRHVWLVPSFFNPHPSLLYS